VQEQSVHDDDALARRLLTRRRMPVPHRSLFLLIFTLTLLATTVLEARPERGKRHERADAVEPDVPDNSLFELRFGPYYPDVDQEFGDRATPFRELFGPSSRLMVGFEYDRLVLADETFGSLGIGLSAGYSSFSAMALLENGERSKQETSFSTLIGSLVLVGRAEGIARLTEAPLAPYARVGLAYGLWWVDVDDGKAQGADGTVGSGSSSGYRYALGMMLLLDALDPGGAVQIRGATGIVNSYLFLEYDASYVNGLTAPAMRLGARTCTAGLAVEL
jgi:hypothetical protein